MRIAQVAPLYESVPPRSYGGTERIVSYLTEELVRQGHDVTLFASGDSTTEARLVPCCRRSLRSDEQCIDPLAWHVAMHEFVLEQDAQFDLLHFHTDYLHFPASRRAAVPHVTTLHGRLDIPDLAPVYRRFADVPVVSISRSQRGPLPSANWVATVHHGLPEDLYRVGRGAGEYLAFLGRISPEKGCDRAIEIAARAGMPLRIAAKVDKVDALYFRSTVEPMLRSGQVTFVGEIGDAEKQDFLGEAAALLFPIDWPEPFGLVMIEAIACGTPVIAFRRGSVTEILEHGSTGFLVEDIDAAVRAVRDVRTLSRQGCRATFERRFTAARMTRDYVRLYQRLLSVRRVAG